MKNDHQPSNIIFNKIQKHDEKFKTFNGYFASFNSFDSLEQLVLVDQKNAEENFRKLKIVSHEIPNYFLDNNIAAYKEEFMLNYCSQLRQVIYQTTDKKDSGDFLKGFTCSRARLDNENFNEVRDGIVQKTIGLVPTCYSSFYVKEKVNSKFNEKQDDVKEIYKFRMDNLLPDIEKIKKKDLCKKIINEKNKLRDEKRKEAVKEIKNNLDKIKKLKVYEEKSWEVLSEENKKNGLRA